MSLIIHSLHAVLIIQTGHAENRLAACIDDSSDARPFLLLGYSSTSVRKEWHHAARASIAQKDYTNLLC